MPQDTEKWSIQYADHVIKKDIPALSHAVRLRVRKTIESKIVTDPLRFGKPLRYSMHHLRSLRVGDYRVLYQVDHEAHVISIVTMLSQ